MIARKSSLVHEVRATPAPFEVLVGGYPADLTDYRDGVTARLPLIAGLIVLVTFVVLFLMTGSVLVPVKAAVLNTLSRSSCSPGSRRSTAAPATRQRPCRSGSPAARHW